MQFVDRFLGSTKTIHELHEIHEVTRKVLGSTFEIDASDIKLVRFTALMPNQEPTSKIPSVPWLWLFVITYVVHIAEEYWGGEGYSAHLLRTKGVYMPPARFLIVQAIGVGLMIAGVLIAKRLRFPNALAIIYGATVLGNAVTHMVNSLRSFEYEPGLISSIVVWVPLGLFTILYFRHYVMNTKRFWISIAIGVGINVAIAVITMRGGRLV